MQKKLVMLAISLTLLCGCASNNVYVLDQQELVRAKAGQSVTPKFDGWVMSDRAVQRIMDVKIKGAGLE